jgi:hypothetical protein
LAKLDYEALKERNIDEMRIGISPFQGFTICVASLPKAAPWAFISRPFRAVFGISPCGSGVAALSVLLIAIASIVRAQDPAGLLDAAGREYRNGNYRATMADLSALSSSVGGLSLPQQLVYWDLRADVAAASNLGMSIVGSPGTDQAGAIGRGDGGRKCAGNGRPIAARSLPVL